MAESVPGANLNRPREREPSTDRRNEPVSVFQSTSNVDSVKTRTDEYVYVC